MTTKFRLPYTIVKRNTVDSLKREIELDNEQFKENYSEIETLKQLNRKFFAYLLGTAFFAGVFFCLAIYFATRKRTPDLGRFRTYH